MKRPRTLLALLLALLVATTGSALLVYGASHREAPLIAQDPTADITDFYAFRSYEAGRRDRVVFIMNVIPAEEPSAGPNYFNFSDDVLYAIHFDTKGDGNAEDLVYEFRFTTEIRPPFNDFPVSYAAVPPITALDGPGSEGLGLRQRYAVTEVRGEKRKELGEGPMFAVPSNVGPGTIPDYEALTAKGIYRLKNGGRVFAGQRDETFYIDLGATFDTLNLRRTPPILTDGEDANDSVNPFGVDMLSGFNVHSIAIEVPVGQVKGKDNLVGAYASTSRRNAAGQWVQVARMANPLVNELLIGTGMKDSWNSQDPKDEAQFLGFYTTSRLAAILNLVFGTSFPTTERTDLVAALLKYPGQDPSGCSGSSPCSELLRLNLGVPPTASGEQKRLTVLAGDPAGWPNGRRPNDDVTDIALRVVAGALLGPVPNLGDGVNFNIGAPGTNVTANGISTQFPFLPTPHDGRNRRHLDCGEADGNPCN